MNPPEENDPVDALLREQNSYVEDGGFTARVIQSLPRRRRAWLRPVILLGAIRLARCWRAGCRGKIYRRWIFRL